jgi:gallate decarboxylase subunit D
VTEETRRRGRLTLRMSTLWMGRDLSVALRGGDREHIGAVAVSQPRPSLSASGTNSATTSVIALLGHKEDELARRVAGRLAAALDATVCVACGVHVDSITAAEIRDVEEMADELADALVARVSAPRLV